VICTELVQEGEEALFEIEFTKFAAICMDEENGRVATLANVDSFAERDSDTSHAADAWNRFVIGVSLDLDFTTNLHLDIPLPRNIDCE